MNAVTYETILTAGNFGKTVNNSHFYITPFRHRLPPDIIGGSTKDAPARRTIRLGFGSLICDADVPTDKKGTPRTFFRDREFVGKFFERTSAKPGDTVLLEEVTPYHLRLRLRRANGVIVEK